MKRADTGINTFTEDLSLWISNHPVIDNKEARQLASHAVMDTMACIILGQDDFSTRIVRKTASQFGSGKCSVTGSGLKLSAPNAALVNATAAHAFDFDDNYIVALTHASAVLVPALIALAEENHSTIDNMVDAYIIGTEVQARIGRIANPHHYEKGWHGTSTIGVIGCAAACAHLLKLNLKQILNSLSIAVSMASGTKKQFGTLTKPFHAGMTAQNGITAAYLAKNGLEANSEPITGDWGFIDLYNNELPESVDNPFDDKLALIKDGLFPKRFPCCGSTHCTLDGILDLMNEHNLSAEEIEKIETSVPEMNYNNLRYRIPVTESEARFSMHYCISVLVNRGELLLSDFTPEAVAARNTIRAYIDKIEMTKYALKKGEDRIHHIQMHLQNGKILKRSIHLVKGSNKNPFTDEDRKNKFHDCVKDYLNADDRADLYNILYELSSYKDIGNLTKYFTR
ncbi:MmgE/PrpD family protein [bacterium]|nr:MmgE/PrpD family protein [bacterium]